MLTEEQAQHQRGERARFLHRDPFGQGIPAAGQIVVLEPVVHRREQFRFDPDQRDVGLDRPRRSAHARSKPAPADRQDQHVKLGHLFQHFQRDRALPGLGVYATRAHVGGQVFKGATNIGTRPTFDAGHVSIETYLMDFEGDIYGERMELEVLHRIRAEKAFAGVDELVAQITTDVEGARAWLA